ncbi:MAG TPA: glycosyltransferase family 39 protein [Gemmataceae bacterium]|jgi:hypothetical protein
MRSWFSANGRRLPADWAFWIGLGLLALGVACRLSVYLLSLPIWRDEASLALNFDSRDYRGLLNELDNFQVAPVLFLWIEKAVYQFLGSSPALLRLAPMLAGVSGLVLFWHLARRCLTPSAAALAVGFLAVAQSPIHLTSMVKPYSFDLFAATTLLTLAVTFLDWPHRNRALIALTLLVPLLVTVSYPVIFVAASVSLVLLPTVWRQAGHTARIWLLAFNALCLATFTAQLRFVGHGGHDPTLPTVSAFMAGFWEGGFLPHELRTIPRWLVHCHTGHLFSYPLAFNGGGLIGLGLVIAGAFSLHQQRRFNLLGLCLLPLSLTFLGGVLRRYPYAADQRLEQHLVPGICLLMGSGASELIQRLPACRRAAMASLTGLFVFVGLSGSIGDVMRPYQDVEAAWAAAIARHLQGQVRPQDRIIVASSERFTLNCLRWQLLPFGEQVCNFARIDWRQLERNAGRLWFIDQMVDQAPVIFEPPVRDPRDISPQIERENWHDTRQVRFLVHEQKTGAKQVFHYCCDLHLLEHSKSQASSGETFAVLASGDGR